MASRWLAAHTAVDGQTPARVTGFVPVPPRVGWGTGTIEGGVTFDGPWSSALRCSSALWSTVCRCG